MVLLFFTFFWGGEGGDDLIFHIFFNHNLQKMATMRVLDPQEPPSETHGTSEAPELRCALKTRWRTLVGRGLWWGGGKESPQNGGEQKVGGS